MVVSQWGDKKATASLFVDSSLAYSNIQALISH